MAYQETIQMKLQSLRGELNVRYPNFKNLFAYPATSFENIQRSLGAGQVLLKYIPLEKALVILQIQADTSFFYEVNISNKAIKELNQNFYHTIQSFNSDSRSATLAEQNLKNLFVITKKMSDQLLTPLKKNLATCKELIILPAPSLAGFPFETLFWDIEKEQHLIEKIPVRYISIGQEINANFSHEGTQPIDFTLINNDGENAFKQKSFGTNMVNFKEIDLNLAGLKNFSVLNQLKKQNGLILFAAPGEWDAPEPANSFLKLKHDNETEILNQAQWFKLQFDESTLLMFPNLSIVPEYENLNYFLLYDVLKMLGSKNFLVSHWPIPVEVAPRFISQLVEKLKQGLELSRALQAIKKDFLSKDVSRHPFYWAGLHYYQ
jgi:CHAT domain-containing protein